MTTPASKPKVVRELTVVRGIIGYVHRLKGLIRKNHGTMFGETGDPDLYGVLRGRAFAVECKTHRKGSKLTRKQGATLKEWARAGAVTGMARSVEEFRALIVGSGLVTADEDLAAATPPHKAPRTAADAGSS